MAPTITSNAGSPVNPWCREVEPYLTSIRGLATFTIPKVQVQVSGTWRNDPGDALAAINYINAFGNIDSGKVPALGTMIAGQTVDSGQPFGFLDANGDNFVAANDALAVINAINAGQGGEGESATSTNERDVLMLLALDTALQPKRRR